QEMIAEELGLSQAAISNYLRGRVPRANTLFAISNHFRVSPTDMLRRDLATGSALERGPDPRELPRQVFKRRPTYERLLERLESLSDEEADRWAKVFLNMLDELKGSGSR